MIGISTITADINGSVIIDDTTDYRDADARISRAKTLDGGVYINNSGVSDGDRTLRVRAKVTKTQGDTIWYIFNNYTAVHVAIDDGFYKAAISRVSIDNGALDMAIYLEIKESD